MQCALNRTGLRAAESFPAAPDKASGTRRSPCRPPPSLAVEQMMSAGNPEITHLRSRSTIEISLTSSPAFVLALDLQEGEGARRLCAVARAQGTESYSANGAFLKRTDEPRSMCRIGCVQSDSTNATSSSAAAMASSTVGAPNCATVVSPGYSTDRHRSSALASTICTSVDHPSVEIPRKPLRNAERVFPSSTCRGRDSRTQTHPTPPIRPAQPPSRIRMYPMCRAVSCG